LEEAPKRIDPVQQQLVGALEALLVNPRYNRMELLGLIDFVSSPKPGVQLKELKGLLARIAAGGMTAEALDELRQMRETHGTTARDRPRSVSGQLSEEDLTLICYDHISGG